VQNITRRISASGVPGRTVLLYKASGAVMRE
jgi:hypothetical protein